MRVSIKAILRSDKPVKANGTSSIHYLVGYDGYQLKIPSGHEITPKHWNKEDGRVKKGTVVYASEINASLGKRIEEFRSFMLQRQILGHSVSKEEIKAHFSGKVSTDCFYEFASAQLHDAKQSKRKGTVENYRFTLNVLKRFRPNLRMGHITLSFIEAFDEHLRQERKNTTSGLFNRHKCFKALLNAAVKKGLIKDNPYRLFRFKNPPRRLDFLTLQEVIALEKISVLSEEVGVAMARDFFLLSCYTGIRFSDLKALRSMDWKDGLLSFTMQKTSKPINVPLIAKAEVILRKYLVQSGSHEDRLPMHTNRRTNMYLREALRRAGIDRPVTFHVARHTFASLHVDLGTHMVLIKDLMGHSSIDQTEIYSKANRESLSRSMASFDRHLEGAGKPVLSSSEQLNGSCLKETPSDASFRR